MGYGDGNRMQLLPGPLPDERIDDEGIPGSGGTLPQVRRNDRRTVPRDDLTGPGGKGQKPPVGRAPTRFPKGYGTSPGCTAGSFRGTRQARVAGRRGKDADTHGGRVRTGCRRAHPRQRVSPRPVSGGTSEKIADRGLRHLRFDPSASARFQRGAGAHGKVPGGSGTPGGFEEPTVESPRGGDTAAGRRHRRCAPRGSPYCTGKNTGLRKVPRGQIAPPGRVLFFSVLPSDPYRNSLYAASVPGRFGISARPHLLATDQRGGRLKRGRETKTIVSSSNQRY